MRLLTALIAAACFSQAASAANLTSGTITNETTATADVVFNQPITLENTLTPVSGLKAGAPSNLDSTDTATTIATGKLAIKEAGVTAQLALRLESPAVYAEGHQGEAAYELAYAAIFDDAEATTWDTFTTSDGSYLISPAGQRQLAYKVYGGGNDDVLPAAGKYTINVTGAVYNP
ncbi:hypothetical protein V8O11_23845 [Erwinia aphidicola]|uniref:Uncharacterized protein n=1 Tax=Erwinia aphidicola TaxID=68334 RepID=A0ABU8DM12_ERWAP